MEKLQIRYTHETYSTKKILKVKKLHIDEEIYQEVRNAAKI